jgi:Putative beta-barrel porin-2, OmpL-like. bbp2
MMRLSGSVAVVAICLASQSAIAADMVVKAPVTGGNCDPYVNYSCLGAYLGSDFVTRLYRYYALEWGHDGAPSDPKAPPARRPEAVWPATPQSTPPMPFTEWPYGGSPSIGVTRPGSVDSPLMVALGNTPLGEAMSASHIQVYGWIEPGANLSSNTVKPGGNVPVGYDYTPNTAQLDQAVFYIERLPDTVQNDHFDWGFRVSGIYGVDYRYTTAYGFLSNQLLNHNLVNGFDMPMLYADLYFPVMQGLNVRIGRFISIPDIEAQLAPNNYTYVHSLTYTYDNFTNTGILGTLAVTRNWMVQLGLVVGTETMPWNVGARIPNPDPNPLYPGTTMLKDPGAQPSAVAGLRWTSDSGRDAVYLVANSINSGAWGYNNLNWLGGTYYHKFNDQWHIGFETWNIHEYGVPNLDNPVAAAAIANGGTPFSPQIMPFNAPNAAHCGNAVALTCTADEQSFLLYVNYSPNKLNNFTFRTEFFMDPEGQRTGVVTNYADVTLGWQHWFSPQIELRPEIAYYRSLNANAFNGNANAGIAPSRNWAVIAASDLIFHF